MSKNIIYLEAIMALPAKWIHEETKVEAYTDEKVIAVNKNFPPMIYTKKRGRWISLKNFNEVIHLDENPKKV